jgi:uncharacterized membrane protein YgdD (TMEM256/DUF423 family)
MNSRRILLAAALLLLLATALGAFGVHALKPRLPAARFESFQNAVQYQFWQGLGLFALGILARTHDSRALRLAAALLLAGTLLFAGSIYAITFGAPRPVVMLAPLGGTALILGWIAALGAIWRLRAQ